MTRLTSCNENTNTTLNTVIVNYKVHLFWGEVINFQVGALLYYESAWFNRMKLISLLSPSLEQVTALYPQSKLFLKDIYYSTTD